MIFSSTAGRARPLFRLSGMMVVLALVLAAGLTVRLIGIRHGAPRWIYHPDVAKQASVAGGYYHLGRAFEPFREDGFKLRLYPYGSSLLLGQTLRAGKKIGLGEPATGTSEQNDKWLWSVRLRVFSAALFLLAVGIVLAALLPRLGLWAGLSTGLLLVLEPLNVRHGHYGMNDIPLVAVLLMAWLCSSRILSGGAGGALFSLLAGLCLGVGFGIKYQALLAVFFPLLAWFYLIRRRSFAAAAVSAALLGAGFVVAVLATVPLLRNHPREFVDLFPRFMAWQASIMRGEVGTWQKIATNVEWLLRFFTRGWIWVFLPGALWAAVRLREKNDDPCDRFLLLSALLFSLLFIVVLLFTRELMRENDLLYVLPFLIIPTGIALRHAGAAERKAYPSFAFICAAGVILLFGAVSLRDSMAFTRTDTRQRAREWCRLNIPAGSRVLRDRYALPVEKRGIGEESFRFLVQSPAAEIIAAGDFDYLIATSLAHDRFLDPLSPYYSDAMRDRYGRLLGDLPVQASFQDRRLPFTHPTVNIYGRGDPRPPPAGQR